MSTERLLARTFVELADTLVDDFDIVDFLHTLADRSAELFDQAQAGVMLADQRGGLQVIATSGAESNRLGFLATQVEQGPSFEAFRGGQAVHARDLTAESRWPEFVAGAQRAGFRGASSLPLRFKAEVLGTLTVLLKGPVPLSDDDLVAAQAMADIATISILHEKALREARILAEQLQRALNSRVAIEQAKGVIAERLQISVDDAFTILRTYSRNKNRNLHDVAAEVTLNRLTAGDLKTSKAKAPTPPRGSSR